jgi:hypothetical protein
VNKGAALAYKPLGLAASVAGGLIAGMVVQQVWKRVTGEEDAPEATNANRGWGAIILAAAIQGAIWPRPWSGCCLTPWPRR